jgi:nitronate monooxygenase
LTNCSPRSPKAKRHRAALAEADDPCTVVTDLISGRPCRYMRNKLIDHLLASGLEPLPVPVQQSLTLRLSETGDPRWTPLTAGQSAALARTTKAAELVEPLADETTAAARLCLTTRCGDGVNI